MKLRDYAQLLGIVDTIPGIDEHLKANVAVASLPDPHGKRLITGRLAFYSFKVMLTALLQLHLVKPVVDAESTSAAPSTGFTMCALQLTAQLPGASSSSAGGTSADTVASAATAASAGGETWSPRTKIAPGTAAQFGITSVSVKDRLYHFDRAGHLHEYWADLEAYGTESACSHQNTADHAIQETTTHDGSAKLPEIFRTKSWAIARSLTAPQRAAVNSAVDHLGFQWPLKEVQDIIRVARHTKISFNSLATYFNAVHHPERPTLPPSRSVVDRAPNSRKTVGKASKQQGRVVSRKTRRAAQKSSGAAVAAPAASDYERHRATTNQTHEPDHVAAFMAKQKSQQQMIIAARADEDTVEAVQCEVRSFRPVARRAANLQWTRQMDLDLARAYMTEAAHVSESTSSRRLSWANVANELQLPAVSAAHARRRWASLLQDKKFSQAVKAASSRSEHPAALLQLAFQGSKNHESLCQLPLPARPEDMYRLFHIRDADACAKQSPQVVMPKLAALMLVLKAVLLVPQECCDRDKVVSLLSRFSTQEIDTAVNAMKAQQLLVFVKGAKVHSRAFRLSTKFYESARIVKQHYFPELFDHAHNADAKLQSRLDSEESCQADEVDAVAGGAFVAGVLARIAAGTLELKSTSLQAEAPDRSSGAAVVGDAVTHASIMQHLLNVGAVQKTTGSGRDTNMAVQLPPWSITLKATSEDTDVQDHTQEISLPPEARSDTIEFTSPTMGLETPQGVIQVANESDLPRGSVLCIYTIVHQAGVEGATAKYITEQFAAAQATEEIRRLANACLANQCLDLLSDRANIARVSAWDHHRYVSTACDHLWSLAGRGTPGVTFLFLIVPAVPI
jgi:hypothetical protein